MLQSLHVKNLALMEETEVEFGPGLNILTGETGAGKSLLIGSINLALGGKFEKEMLRSGADSALVELVFSADTKQIRDKLSEMELEIPEEKIVVISRKMQPGKSICKINGETVTVKQVKEIAEVLIDIHGQHEHQSLLHKKKHLEILDSFCGPDFQKLLNDTAKQFSKCKAIKQKLEEEMLDETAKAKEQALAEFEFQEIEEAGLKPGEDEELEQRYRVMVNSRKIMENLSECYCFTGGDSDTGSGSLIGRALRALSSISGYDKQLAELENQLAEVDNLINDFNREISAYMENCEFDDEEFCSVEERLNLINHLKGKYGNSINSILEYKEERRRDLEKFSDYDAYIGKLQKDLEKAEQDLNKYCKELSKIRSINAKHLENQLLDALVQLNFLTVQFEISVRPEQTLTASGYDEVEFLISTNPGEAVKPLGQVASGGELSRVMLAIKTVMAGKDEIDTLIFDEIDAGISGKTAWKVSKQLDVVGRKHQVICITHLPQIAAMADHHFCIEKSSDTGNTITTIQKLDEEGSLSEVARLLGSDCLTEAALSNARQMRIQALEAKGK